MILSQGRLLQQALLSWGCLPGNQPRSQSTSYSCKWLPPDNQLHTLTGLPLLTQDPGHDPLPDTGEDLCIPPDPICVFWQLLGNAAKFLPRIPEYTAHIAPNRDVAVYPKQCSAPSDQILRAVPFPPGET